MYQQFNIDAYIPHLFYMFFFESFFLCNFEYSNF
ncbi:hypothetical protein OIU77_001838, partial [Salix suchowensis]